jgi:high affinity Mn2+ porin
MDSASNMEQEIAKSIGIFARLGWNDGKTESFEFTAMDRLATGGVSFSATRWKRTDDTVGTEVTTGGISALCAL